MGIRRKMLLLLVYLLVELVGLLFVLEVLLLNSSRWVFLFLCFPLLAPSKCLIPLSPEEGDTMWTELMAGPTTTRIPNIPRLAPYPLRETPTIHLSPPSTKHLIIPPSSRDISIHNPSISHSPIFHWRGHKTTTIRSSHHSPGRQDDHQISRIRRIVYRLETSFR
jgi:hypothetical protein